LHHQKAVQTTEHVLLDPNVSSIFEAAFLYLYLRVLGILHKRHARALDLLSPRDFTEKVQ
jgi:hypothetical protein